LQMQSIEHVTTKRSTKNASVDDASRLDNLARSL